ncbi:Allantoicase [Coemansia sp. RSA 1822]|nr:Allantoicase [Coemansia sp. RSA 1822]
MGNVQSSLPAYYNADPTNEAYTHSLSKYVDLASAAIGAKVIKASDERFGAATNLIKPSEPTDDAWVTRRHNPEADWVVVRLGSSGTIAGFDIDTRGLDGTHASQVSIQGCLASEDSVVDSHGNVEGAEWTELLPRIEVSANSRHLLALWTPTSDAFNFVRLVLHPDGGVARLRIYGTVALIRSQGECDLACVTSGARVVSASDETLGAKEALILPTQASATDSSNVRGWKTRRSRTDEHHDWAIIKLGEPGFLTRVEIDTATFDGDQPVRASIHACYTELESPERDAECFWYEIASRTELNANMCHKIDVQLNDVPFSHIKVVIHPDGGVSRVRAFGQRVAEIEKEAARECAEAAAEAVVAAEIATDSNDSQDVADASSSDAPSDKPATPKSPARSPPSARAKPQTPQKKPTLARVESSADETSESTTLHKKSKKADKPEIRKKKAKKLESIDVKSDTQFSSRAGELIMSLTSPLPAKKRSRTRSRADDDNESVHTVDSLGKRSRRKAKNTTA